MLCNVGDGDPEPSELVAASDGTFSADISACGRVTDIAIQATAFEPGPTRLTRVDLCDDERASCVPLLVTGRGLHRSLLGDAATWASERGLRLYLGEFGVFDTPGSPVDQPSRLAWIESVRRAAESVGASWAVFEMGGEFGAYDHQLDRWDPGILEALGLG